MTDKEFFDIDFKDEKIDIKAILYKYLRYWPLILLGVIISLSLAFVFLKTKNDLYGATAKIQIVDNKETPNFSLDLKGLLGKSKVNLDNEIAVLKSYRIVEQVVEKLELNVSYYAKGNFVKRQSFSTPFSVSHVLPVSEIKKTEVININITNSGYLLTKEIKGEEIKKEVKGYEYKGEDSNFPIVIDIIKEYSKDVFDITFTVVVNSLSTATKNYVNKVKISPVGKTSELLSLSVQTQNGSLSKDVINKLVDVYEKDGIKDRQRIFKRTIEFVDERFKYLVSELEAIENSKKEFKQENKVSLFETDAGVTIQQNSMKNNELFQIETQLELAEILEASLISEGENELLPSNIGVDSEIINQLTTEYNSFILKRDKLKISAGANNPMLGKLSMEIRGKRKNILKSIKGYLEQLKTTRNRVQSSQISTKNYFKELPEKEKTLRRIARQQNLKESLYLLLLQKREESAINYAVTVSDIKVIDYAIISGPIRPNKLKIYIIAMFAGAIVPILFLYLRFLLNTKVSLSNDIEAIVKNAPILGTIPLLKDEKISDDNSRSILKESFRTLLTNVKFVVPNTSNGIGKTILVTSSIKGEGKTLVSYNLASEVSGHKGRVILIGADLRNPQLHKYLEVGNVNKGLSSYLNDDSIKVNDLEIYNPEDLPNLDILFAGAIPPNPTSLLSNDRFEELLNVLKKTYDYIIIDSAPTLLVSDTLIFGKLVDTTVYVTRANHTEKNIIEYSKRLIDEKKLNNVAYVLNGVEARTGYGYNYNYAYSYSYTYDDDEQDKKWYHFFKR